MGATSSLSGGGLGGFDLGMILTIVFLSFVLLGFIVGLIRGLKKTIIRMIWILVLGVITIFITTPLTLHLVRADISAIPFIGDVLNGAKSIEEFLTITLSQAIEGVDIQIVKNVVALLTSVVAMFISGIVFLLLFIILKYLSIPFYAILNIFIGRTKKGKSKHRFIGGLVGMVLGVVIFTFISTPFVGYVNVIKQIDKINVPSVALARAVDESGDKNNGGLISNSPFGEILNDLSSSPVMVIYNSTGLKKLQILMFNETSAVTVDGEKIKINDEVDAFGKILVNVAPFTDGTYDLSNMEELTNDPEQFQAVLDGVNGVIDSLYESKILKKSMTYAMPLVKTFIEDTVVEVIETNESISSDLKDPTVVVIKDFCNGLLDAEAEDVRTALGAVFNIVKVLPKLSVENPMEALTIDDFGTLGNVLDAFIESGLVKGESISNLVPEIINVVINTSDDSSIPESLRSVLTDVKESFENNNDMVYSNEFKAIGEIVIGINDLNLEDDSEGFNANKIKHVGTILDNSASHNSVIITNTLIDDIVLTMLDMLDLGDVSSDSEFEDIFDKIKTPFEEHTITSYAVEFDAIAETISLFNDVGNEEAINYSNFGERLDGIVNKGSKIINHAFVNDFIHLLIDEIAEVETQDFDFTETLEDIKNNFTGNDLSYKVEFVSIEKIINLVDNLEDSDFEITKLGSTFDEIIALDSKVITRQIINSMIQQAIDVVVDIDTPSHADFTSNIQGIKDGFNRNDLVYTTEFNAIDELIDSINSMQESDYDLIEIGKNLDDIVAHNSKVVSKSLINEFLSSSFKDYVTEDCISHAGKLATSLSTIKSRLVDPNYEIASYETEFTAIDKLIEISEVAGAVTITHIEDKVLENGTKSISEVFDDKIKDSILVGDSGLIEMGVLLKEFEEANNGKAGKRDYTEIILIIEDNFDALKPTVKCGSNKNLNSNNTLSYQDITHAFTEIVTYLDSEETKITDQTEFDIHIANRYESVLYKLESNILLDKNGTRAVAAYVADEIADVLEEKAVQASSVPTVANKIREVKTIILNYKDYVDRPNTLVNNRLDELEPYDKAGPHEYVYSTDGFKTNVTYTTDSSVLPSGKYAYRNCPFSSIAELLPTT